MHVVIVGNGIAGTTVARHVRKLDRKARITMISGESDHHYSRPALMYIFMGHMGYDQTKPYADRFWRKNRIDLIRGWVTRIDTEARRVHIGGQDAIAYDKLVLATGSTPNRFGWPGQDLERVQGLYALQDLERLEACVSEVKRAVIVGGGLIGIELAEMLLTRGKAVTFLVRESAYWNNVLPPEEAEMVTQLVRHHGIDLRLETELDAILDDGQGRAGGVVTRAGERIACELVGLTAGVRPNTALAEASEVPTGRGILVDWKLRTRVEDVYACGDCAEIVTEGEGRNLLQQVWYTGRMQGEVCARNLLGAEDDYDPGIWYNSAKFFDLEYQTYGTVPSAGRPDPDLSHHVWRKGGRLIRLVTDAEDVVVGFNLLGVRMRHRVCEAWIAARTPRRKVLGELRRAGFDPEFSPGLSAPARALGGS